MATLTLQHFAGDRLDPLIKALKKSWKDTKTGRRWVSFKEDFGIKHVITSMEVRASVKRGWHPHLHVLFLCASEVDANRFKNQLTAIYTGKLAKNGGYASRYHGIEVTSGNEGISSYLAKWDFGSELLSGNSKNGRKSGSFNAWNLAVLAEEGDTWARDKFKEYAQGTYGKKAITYSKGTKKELGITDKFKVEELSEGDLQLKFEEEVIAVITRPDWNTIQRSGRVGEVLYVADNQGKAGVMKLLQHLKLSGVGMDPPKIYVN